MFKYALKRVVRSYRLFVALTIGVLVATTFFASTNVSADLLARDALDGAIEGVVYDFVANDRQGSNWTADTFEKVEAEISAVSHIVSHTRTTEISWDYNNSGTQFQVYGLEWDSNMAQGIQVVSGATSLGPNETYVIQGSQNESLFEIGQEITVPISVQLSTPPYEKTINWNMTVAGYVSVSEDHLYALTQRLNMNLLLEAYGLGQPFVYNAFVADWDLTMAPVLDACSTVNNSTLYGVLNSIHCRIDRDTLIDPYNIDASITRVQDTRQALLSRIERFGATVDSRLTLPLQMYLMISLMMNITFMGLSLPIFFMAYFTGTMVSDVGYNLRRREIGLLLTKGYKRGTIRNMFLIEGVVVGALAGAVSTFLGTAISFFVIAPSGMSYLSVITNNPISIVISVILGMVLALISVWRPANRASRLELLDALKHYVYVEETSEYKRLLPTITFVLGTYKIIVWLLGIDMNVLLTGLSPGNWILAIAIIAWLAVDGVLNTLGPLFFLYGATKIFMRGSTKFQETVVNAGKRFFGAFGKIATRNVKRNPARNAALVFIVSLIVSYGVFSIGSLFSEYDRVDREAKYDVGADIRLELKDGVNTGGILENITAEEGVLSATPEYRLSLTSGERDISTRGIKPQEWLETAFYESQWFIGDVKDVMSELERGDGIILSVRMADVLGLEVGDDIYVKGPLSSSSHRLRIVGLIGYQSFLERYVEDFAVSAAGSYPSYVSYSFLNDTGLVDAATANILIDNPATTNGTKLQEEFMSYFPESIYRSYSYTSEIKNHYEQPIESGTTKIQWVAVVFAVILAVVGTGLVIILTLREKESEIALLTVRGFSKWQLFKTLFAEVMVMVGFSLLLGSAVGVIQIFGNTNLQSQNISGLIQPRVVLGGLAGLYMILIVLAVILAAALPVYWESRKPEAKVDVLR
ncbi:MAG: FtsX-like permease family protein [Candidatus Thorarchaeota archaeon]